MLSSFLSSSPTFLEVFLLSFIALLGGVAFSFLYSFLKKKENYYKDMVITYALFPFLVTIAIIGVTLLTLNTSENELTTRIGRVSVALLSALLIFRFRSELRNYEDLTYLLLLSIFALLLGSGYLLLGLFYFAICLLLIVIFHLLHFPRRDSNCYNLSISVPENLNYDDAFKAILDRYCSNYELEKIKTTDLGSVFILTYQLSLKKGASQKEFLDEIRSRNSNLNVSLSLQSFKA